MKVFLKKIFEGSGVIPPFACLQSLNENFSDAVNVDWYKREDNYEVLFYRNMQEHIALFNLNGDLLEYRQNLSLECLPENITKNAMAKGEIMNSVLRNKGNLLEYELIVRDSDLRRHLVLFSETGDVQEMKTL